MLFFTICFIIGITQTNAQIYGPKDLYYPHIKEWYWRIQQKPFMNMTMEIVRDTTYKLKHAERIQDEHKGSIGYELGTIAAGILERFLYMLKLYRRFALIKSLVEDNELVEDYMTALYNMQGAYHEIHLERIMFFNILKAHKNIDPKKVREDKVRKKMKHRMASVSPQPKPVGRRQAWRPAAERFDVGLGFNKR